MTQQSIHLNKTLVFLKPDVFEKHCMGKVIEEFEKNHFEIYAIKNNEIISSAS